MKHVVAFLAGALAGYHLVRELARQDPPPAVTVYLSVDPTKVAVREIAEQVRVELLRSARRGGGLGFQ